jgi:hypothetical protein
MDHGFNSWAMGMPVEINAPDKAVRFVAARRAAEKAAEVTVTTPVDFQPRKWTNTQHDESLAAARLVFLILFSGLIGAYFASQRGCEIRQAVPVGVYQ